MSCAACAAAIEGGVERRPGFSATVNLATGQAAVRCEEAVPVSELVAAVEAVGYGAAPGGRARPRPRAKPPPRPRLPPRLVLAVFLSLPVALLAMVPGARLRRLGWVALAPLDAGRLLRRLRLPPLGAPERPPPVGDDGHPGLARDARCLGLVGGRARRGALAPDTYFEVAAVGDDA